MSEMQGYVIVEHRGEYVAVPSSLGLEMTRDRAERLAKQFEGFAREREALSINADSMHAELERLRQVKLWARRVYGWLGAVVENGMVQQDGAAEQFYKSAPSDVKGPPQ